MNLTELIFKFIDGTITREEDAILRKMIEENPSLKQEYNTLLNIDFEIKKDASEIDYPTEFFDNIKREIKNKINADNQKAISKRKSANRRNFATMLGIMIILFISGIENPFIDLSNLITKNNSPQISSELQNIEAKTDKIHNSNPQKKHQKSRKIVRGQEQIALYSSITNNSQSFIASDSGNDNTDLAPIESTNSQLAYNVQMKTQNYDNTDFSTEQYKKNIQRKSQTLNQMYSNNLNPNIMSPLPLMQNSQKVEINSFFGSDIVSFGANKSNSTVTSFTQSIAYDLTSKSKIGIETGYIQIGINKDKYLEIKPTSIDELGSTINSGGSHLLMKTPGTENYDQQIIWAGLFYERNILEFNDITLSSRIGAGFSGDGFVGNVKLIALYRLSKSINFTIGGESKLFSGNSDYLNGNNTFSSTISLIYGVQFGF